MDCAVFVLQFALRGNALQQRFQIRQFARLGQIIVSAVAQRGDRALDRRFARQNHGRRVGVKFLGARDDFDPAQPGHVEINDDAVVHVTFERGDRRQPVGANGDFVAEAREFDAHQLLERALVVGEQQFQRFTQRFGGDDATPYVCRLAVPCLRLPAAT